MQTTKTQKQFVLTFILQPLLAILLLTPSYRPSGKSRISQVDAERKKPHFLVLTPPFPRHLFHTSPTLTQGKTREI